MAMTRKKAILISCIVILLGAGLLAYGAFSRDADRPCEPRSEAEKLAELEAALVEAAETGGKKQVESEPAKQVRTSRPTRTRST